MAIEAHLVELERKHKVLENELHEAPLNGRPADCRAQAPEADGQGCDRAVEAYRQRNAALITLQQLRLCRLAGMNETRSSPGPVL